MGSATDRQTDTQRERQADSSGHNTSFIGGGNNNATTDDLYGTVIMALTAIGTISVGLCDECRAHAPANSSNKPIALRRRSAVLCAANVHTQ